MKKNWGKTKRKRVGDTQHVRSFGKWRQHRLSDGVDYPVATYNINDKKAVDNDFDSLINTMPPGKR